MEKIRQNQWQVLLAGSRVENAVAIVCLLKRHKKEVDHMAAVFLCDAKSCTPLTVRSNGVISDSHNELSK